MRNLLSVTLALMVSGGLMAQAQDASTAEQAGPAAVNSATSYVVAAGQSDQFEIQEGKLAQSMGQSRKVRAFGKEMIADHTRSTHEVMAAALQSGLPEMPPPPLRPDQQQMIAQLQAASGPAFDQLYVQQQLQSHRQALTLQQGYAQNGSDPNLRGVATKIVPVVQQHLSMLQGMTSAM